MVLTKYITFKKMYHKAGNLIRAKWLIFEFEIA